MEKTDRMYMTEALTGPLGSRFLKVRLPERISGAVSGFLSRKRLGKRIHMDAASGALSWMEPSSMHGSVCGALSGVIRDALGTADGIRFSDGTDI